MGNQQLRTRKENYINILLKLNEQVAQNASLAETFFKKKEDDMFWSVRKRIAVLKNALYASVIERNPDLKLAALWKRKSQKSASSFLLLVRKLIGGVAKQQKEKIMCTMNLKMVQYSTTSQQESLLAASVAMAA